MREVEKRDFLQKLVDDDEFQEDMALSHARDAVDAVVRDFNAVARFTGDARVMRVLEKFRVVQRFCKARGFKITFADVRAADAAEAEAGAGRWASSGNAPTPRWRRRAAPRRERGRFFGKRRRDRRRRRDRTAEIDRRFEAGFEASVARECARSRRSAADSLSLVAAIVALCVAPRVSGARRAARSGRGWFFFEGDGDDS